MCKVKRFFGHELPPIRFALLLPGLTHQSSWSPGPRIAGAAEMAVQTVNADKTLLPGRVLAFSFADSGCSAKQGLKAMGELLDGREISAVIGPGCRSDWPDWPNRPT